MTLHVELQKDLNGCADLWLFLLNGSFVVAYRLSSSVHLVCFFVEPDARMKKPRVSAFKNTIA